MLKLLRDSAESSPIGSKSVSRCARELLECPVCLEDMYPPIHQCCNGHPLCRACKPKVKNKCPTCRQALGDIRCLSLEKIAVSLVIPCKYQKLGCFGIYPNTTTSKVEHESRCIFRPYNCPLSACSAYSVEGDISHLLTHLKDVHEIREGTTLFKQCYVKVNLYSRSDKWKLTVFSCLGQYFCLHFKTLQLGLRPAYFAFLQFMGDYNEAKMYTYSLQVGSDRKKMIWQGAPRSIRDSPQKVCDSFDGLIIMRDVAREFSDSDQKELDLKVIGKIWMEE